MRRGKYKGREHVVKETRVGMEGNKLVNAMQKVTDKQGATPLRYQRGYLDPEGRVFSIELRKQF